MIDVSEEFEQLEERGFKILQENGIEIEEMPKDNVYRVECMIDFVNCRKELEDEHKRDCIAIIIASNGKFVSIPHVLDHAKSPTKNLSDVCAEKFLSFKSLITKER